MPKESQTDPRRGFVPRYLPWLLGAAMFCFFAATLNHWIALLNVGQITAVSGWNWRPQATNPLLYLATLPFRMLPAARMPMALNFFAAFCGAASLAVLARSVAILPHDRTELERDRERNDLAFLTGWVAWIPPVTAVIFAGLQLGFWKNATSFTGESFDLLIFAVILWQLLEYRLDERDGRLIAGGVLFGAGVAENWGLVGYFPLFLMMIIWLRKMDFFDFGFLARMTAAGLVGLLFFLFLPIIITLSGRYPVTFWQLLKPGLQTDWLVLKSLGTPEVRHSLALMALTTLIPAFVMSIRWSATFGDSSRLGAIIVNYMMHLVNAVILGVLFWIMFDPVLSPQKLSEELGVSAPALTLYYVAALCIGFFTGYPLLIFGKAAVPTRRNPRPDAALPRPLRWLGPVIVGVMLAVTLLMICALYYRNAPIIRAANDDTLLKYARLLEQKLPPNGAVVLCDSDDQRADVPLRADLLRAVLARDGRLENYPVVDTMSLDYPTYHRFLHQKFPAIWPQDVGTNELVMMDARKTLKLLEGYASSNSLCYLNPSFGYFFEELYQVPHGMIYGMKLLPADTLVPPALSRDVIAENVEFWNQAISGSRAAIGKAQNPIVYKTIKNPMAWLLSHLRVTPETDNNALQVGEYFSRDLNFLGVQVERAGDLPTAASLFAEAEELNSNNVVAAINLEFNRNLRAGSPNQVNLSRVVTDQFGKYGSWNEVLGANGPFDETSFCFENGVFLMQNGMARQAVASFDRVRRLAPDNLAARLFLAQIYVFARRPDQALEVLHEPLTQPTRFALNDYNSTELNVLAASAYFQKNENAAGVALLQPEVTRHPDNDQLLTTTVQSYLMRGLYTNALQVINMKLTRNPDAAAWVYGKGYASLQLGAYHEAEVAFTHLLQMQSNNPDALFNRGYAYFQNGRLDAARKDFLQLQAAHPENYQVAFGLGEIAWRQQQTNEAARNYKVFLANAPTNAPELKSVRDRLAQTGVK